MHLLCNDFKGGTGKDVFKALITVCCTDKMHGKCQGVEINRINAFSLTFLRLPGENKMRNINANC